MCARAVKANLSALDFSCTELSVSATVHPDVALLKQSCEVRLLAVEAFIRGSIAQHSFGVVSPSIQFGQRSGS